MAPERQRRPIDFPVPGRAYNTMFSEALLAHSIVETSSLLKFA